MPLASGFWVVHSCCLHRLHARVRRSCDRLARRWSRDLEQTLIPRGKLYILSTSSSYLSESRTFQSCTQLPNGSYAKDLSQVDPDLSRICLLDNSPISYSLDQGQRVFLIASMVVVCSHFACSKRDSYRRLVFRSVRRGALGPPPRP